MNRKKEQLRRKKGQEKTVTDRRKDTNGCEEQKSNRKTDETREIKDGCAGGEKDRNKDSRTKNSKKRKKSPTNCHDSGTDVKKSSVRFLGFPGKLKKKLTNIRLTFRGFYDKIKRWRTLWNEESTLAALHFLTEKGRKLIRHVLPRKIRGSITFGCEDPALTGQILGAVAIAYPLYGKGVAVYPRFEEKILEGQLQMKGRIVVACLLWQAWKIYRNPDVRKTLKKIR